MRYNKVKPLCSMSETNTCIYSKYKSTCYRALPAQLCYVDLWPGLAEPVPVVALLVDGVLQEQLLALVDHGKPVQ